MITKSLINENIKENGVLHLRNLELGPEDISHILDIIDIEALTSLSLSYNPNIGDAGLMNMLPHLPSSLHELGLVHCGLTDTGGEKLLAWLKQSTNIQTLCLEKNHFSEDVTYKFQQIQGVYL